MVNRNEISPIFDAYIKDMRAGLKKPLRKTGLRGNRYTSNTIATGLLYRSLRTYYLETETRLEIEVRGTRYWREADAGPQPDTPIPQLSSLSRWLAAKGVEMNPKSLQRKLIRFGPNRPYSRFATDATPGFVRRLGEALPDAFVRDFARDVEGMITDVQAEIK